MAKEWTCLYCNSRNPFSTRFCLKCNASFLDMTRQYSESQDQEAIFNLSPDARPDPLKSRVRQEYAGEVPAPGSLIGGLFQIARAVEEGKINSEQYRIVLHEMLPRLETVFEQVITELESLSEEADDYIAMVREMLKSVLFMLSVGIEEMTEYAEDKDASHLFNGLRLAQKAEMDYIDVAKMLYSDSKMNPYAGQTDVLSDLASRVVNGKIDIDTFHSLVTNLKQNLDLMIREGQELLDEGYKKTTTFDGTDESVLFSAVEDFKNAGEHLAGVIINLHNMEDTYQVVHEIVEEVVDAMERG